MNNRKDRLEQSEVVTNHEDDLTAMRGKRIGCSPTEPQLYGREDSGYEEISFGRRVFIVAVVALIVSTTAVDYTRKQYKLAYELHQRAIAVTKPKLGIFPEAIPGS